MRQSIVHIALVVRDYDEAIELSRDCPHIEYGASLEIREVEQG